MFNVVVTFKTSVNSLIGIFSSCFKMWAFHHPGAQLTECSYDPLDRNVVWTPMISGGCV